MNQKPEFHSMSVNSLRPVTPIETVQLRLREANTSRHWTPVCNPPDSSSSVILGANCKEPGAVQAIGDMSRRPPRS